MSQKIDYKNTFFSLFVGLAAYFLFIKEKEKQKIKPVLQVGDLTAAGSPYVSKYFSDREYFGANAIPDKYVASWWKLARQLDIIREKFGSAVIISRGFAPSAGIITDLYQTCQAVEIWPENNNHNKLFEVVSDLVAGGHLNIVSFVKLQNNAVKITINE